MVQKAVEMGAASLQPVLTRFTQVARVNGERMRANVDRGRRAMRHPEPCRPSPSRLPLDRYLGQRDAAAPAGFLRRGRRRRNPVAGAARPSWPAPAGIDVLIGPEGGFAEEERALLLRQQRILRLSLGPRILRADTAAVAALALVQARARRLDR